MTAVRWTVLVPMRALPSAKSRLAATLPPDRHAETVRAIRADTLAAVRAAAPVARVVVIGDAPGADVGLVQTSPGLNGALRDGAAFAAQHWPADGVAALVKAEADAAAATVARQWRASEAGPELLEAHPELVRSSPELQATVERTVRDWQGDVLDIVRAEGGEVVVSPSVAAAVWLERSIRP